MLEHTAGHPLAGEHPRIQSYIGVPIILSDGRLYGTLCGVDPAPHAIPDAKRDLVVLLARLLATQLEREAVHRELEAAATVREERARLEGVLLAGRTATHVVNNRLTVAIGFLDVALKEPSVPQTVSQHLEEAARGAREAAKALQQLEQVTRIEEVQHGTGIAPTLDLVRSSLIELEQRQQFLDALLNAVDVGIVACDEQGRVTLFNRVMHEYYGAPLAQVQPDQWVAHFDLRQADGSRPLAAEQLPLARALQGRAVRDMELTTPGRSGLARTLLVNGGPIRRDDGSIAGAVVALHDVTARRQAQRDVQQINAKLRAALDELRMRQAQAVHQERLRVVGEMATGLAHDFNNALAPVVGYTELLLMRPEELGQPDHAQQVQQYLQLIHAGATDAVAVVRRLRETYRPMSDDTGEASLNDVVAQTVALTQPRWRDQAQAQGRTVQVTTDLAPVAAVQASASELRELLTNLIFNAVDALPNGGTVTLRTRSDTRFGHLEVCDTGTGMTEAVRQRALEPFFSTKGEQGSGLGLAMVHGTVVRLGGALDIDSAPGRGTRIHMTFPLVEPSGNGGDTDAASGGAAMAASVPAIRPLAVLVVDDDPAVRTTTTALVSALGHTVQVAGGGREAMQLLKQHAFDVVITDLSMPEMSGEQLAARTKARWPTLPVLLLTGFGDLMQDQDASSNVDQVLAKPPSLAALRSALTAHCTPRNTSNHGAVTGQRVTSPMRASAEATPSDADTGVAASRLALREERRKLMRELRARRHDLGAVSEALRDTREQLGRLLAGFEGIGGGEKVERKVRDECARLRQQLQMVTVEVAALVGEDVAEDVGDAGSSTPDEGAA